MSRLLSLVLVASFVGLCVAPESDESKVLPLIKVKPNTKSIDKDQLKATGLTAKKLAKSDIVSMFEASGADAKGIRDIAELGPYVTFVRDKAYLEMCRCSCSIMSNLIYLDGTYRSSVCVGFWTTPGTKVYGIDFLIWPSANAQLSLAADGEWTETTLSSNKRHLFASMECQGGFHWFRLYCQRGEAQIRTISIYVAENQP